MRFYRRDKGQLSLFKNFLLCLYLHLYTLKKWDMIMITLYKSIPIRFAQKKDPKYKFRSLVYEIFEKEMRDNYLNIFGDFL